MTDRPNIAVVAAGHTGSSILVSMIQQLGWVAGDVKPNVMEHKAVQTVNKRVLLYRHICPCGSNNVTVGDFALTCHKCRQTSHIPEDLPHYAEMRQALPATEPYVIKDPRFTLTWSFWQSIFDEPPLLLHLERDVARMQQTYARYGFGDGIYGRSIEELMALAREHYERWNGPKLSLDYEQIADAVGLFDMGRAK